MYAEALEGATPMLLEMWNAISAEAAVNAVLPCCGSRAWAQALAAQRPLTSLSELLAASDAAWWALPQADWQEAFDSHPRIGERHAPGTATAASLALSAGEQTTAAASAKTTQTALAEGNRAYEAKFQRVFLIRAAGRSAEEILATLQQRMGNTPDAELRESAEQQCEITHLRLQQWVSEHDRKAAA